MNKKQKAAIARLEVALKRVKQSGLLLARANGNVVAFSSEQFIEVSIRGSQGPLTVNEVIDSLDHVVVVPMSLYADDSQ